MLSAVLLSLCLGTGQDPILIDFGTAESPVERGHVRATGSEAYEAAAGRGFLTKGQSGFRLRRPKPDPNSWRLGPDIHFRNYATPLTTDGIRSAGEIAYRVDVPAGTYRVTTSLGDLLTSMGSVTLSANGRVIEKNIAFQHGIYRQICGSQKVKRGSSGVYGNVRRIRFTVAAPEGSIVIRLRKDQSDYDRLLETEKRKGKPISWAAGRALRGATPPYENIGEPFVDIPLLGLEVRPHGAPPVTMPEHGTLKYAGSCKAVARAVSAFNAGRYASAEAALDAGSEDGLAAGLTYLRLAGWPPVDGEMRLLGKAKKLLADKPAALEERESIRHFEKAMKHHLGRGEPGKNHFVENVQACHLFRRIPPGDALYWRAYLHAARTALQLDPHRWATSGRTAVKWMAEIREKFPKNPYAVYTVTDTYDEKTGPWVLPNYSKTHRDAPAWAARLHEAYDLTLELSEWWIRNKQKEDGSIGGGWGDDVELVGLFGYYAFISEGSSPVSLKGASRLVNGMYLYSGDIEPESGYIWNLSDSEHSAEWTGDTLPMMLLLDYGNPLWIERGMASARLMRDLWTGVNARGHRHFRSNYTGGLGIGGGYRANDSAINKRCIFPAERVHWYNRHPEIERLIVEWASAWAEDAMRTDKGKPRGFLPGNVAYEDCEIGGMGAPTWYGKKGGPGTVNYEFGGYHAYHVGLLLSAYDLTGDDKFLEPVRLEAEAYAKMKGVREDINAPAGSPEKIKSVLRIAYQAWTERTNSARTGEKATYDSVVAQCSQIIGTIRKRWPVMTTEASATDRVAYGGCVTPFMLYSGGEGKGLATLTVSATYEGIGRDFAAFISESSPRRLAVRLYAFRDGPVEMAIRPWSLEMGGTYTVRVAPDADHDGKPDAEGVKKEFRLSQRGQPCPIRIAGRTTHLITFEQTKKGRGQKPAPDLSLWEGDIEYSNEREYITVRVHNTGTTEAREVPVVLYEGSKVVGRALINHLGWPRDLVPMTVKLGWHYRTKQPEATFTAVVDPENAVAEIVEGNNRATRTIRFDPSKRAGATPP